MFLLSGPARRFAFLKPSPKQKLVGVPGVEPGTSSLSGTRSNQLSYTPELEIRNSKLEIRNSDFLRCAQVGGGRRVRTDDIQLAKLALYQLSYTPVRSDRLPNRQSNDITIRVSIQKRCDLHKHYVVLRVATERCFVAEAVTLSC